MSEAPPHPRDVFDWLGDPAPEVLFADAIARARLHHAWLLTGAEGLGKATFAYRAARRLLGASPDASLGPLGSSPTHPVSRQVAARAHPDLLVLQRDPEDGRVRSAIPVAEARVLPEFFSKSPAAAPYRVAIVDTADDLNDFGANAVLKILEEPPERGMILLVSHAPAGLPATLRSRCRRLRFAAPDPAIGAAFLSRKAGVAEDAAGRLLAMSLGAPGQAWRLAQAGAIEVEETAERIVEALPGVDEAAMVALAESFRGAAGQARFDLLLARIAAWAASRARALCDRGDSDLAAERWARAFEVLSRLPRQAQAVNLDRGDAFFTALAALRAAAC